MPKIKICGIFRADDVLFVNEAMPDYAGFVFAKSRRQVSHSLARQLRSKLNKDILTVGVFSNELPSKIITLCEEGIISIVQLHGCESEEYIRKLKLCCNAPIIKATRVTYAYDIKRAQDSVADYLLLDSGAGTGQSFDWRLIEEMTRPFFLAGGVNADNIERALALHPYGIDVSSGVESNGLKDKEKIITMVQRLRCAE